MAEGYDFHFPVFLIFLFNEARMTEWEETSQDLYVRQTTILLYPHK